MKTSIFLHVHRATTLVQMKIYQRQNHLRKYGKLNEKGIKHWKQLPAC